MSIFVLSSTLNSRFFLFNLSKNFKTEPMMIRIYLRIQNVCKKRSHNAIGLKRGETILHTRRDTRFKSGNLHLILSVGFCASGHSYQQFGHSFCIPRTCCNFMDFPGIQKTFYVHTFCGHIKGIKRGFVFRAIDVSTGSCLWVITSLCSSAT